LYKVLFLECVAILAAFLGPSKAVPLMRAIELLESHFEKVIYIQSRFCNIQFYVDKNENVAVQFLSS